MRRLNIRGAYRWTAVFAAVWLAMAAVSAMPAAASAYRDAVDAAFDGWLRSLRPDARAMGVSDATFNSALKGVKLDWSLPDLDPPDLGPGQPARPQEKPHAEKKQPEFSSPARYFPERNISALARIGASELARYSDTLKKIEARYGVPPQFVLAIWGRETAYGRVAIPHYAIQALATQAFLGRRKDKFREELLEGLKILQEGHITRAEMRSSWAGAMGHTQFLPSDFMRYAVDFNGDGKRDIWDTIPDALASTANFLHKNGWVPDMPWGYEIDLPKPFDCTLAGPHNARTIGAWAKLGITRTRGRAFPDDRLGQQAFLLIPAGSKGPAFLAMKNFSVLKTYNTSDLYALYVGHVGDRIIDNRPFEAAWPGVSTFSRAEVRVLQEKLRQLHFDIGTIDGLIGFRTRKAVGEYQKRYGLPLTCYPSAKVIAHALLVAKIN